MRKQNLALAIVAIFTSVNIYSQSFTADVSKSTVSWLGEKVTGEHSGKIQLKSGELSLKDDKITSGMFIIDMTSITNEDLTNDEYNKKLVDHLKSDDFFGADKFPEATLIIEESSLFVNGSAEIKADLTIRDKTNPITFSVNKNGNVYTAKIIVDRSKYDVKYRSESFFEGLGDKMIYNDFTLDVTLYMEKEPNS